uniref:Cytochrome P450 n=1 Tax=Nothapodytes nimmoniana TaxID=159386 RepID=A0A7L7RB33_NOTNI|nr:cytochrome P450 [Nothapodytes nimmoniana]
MGNLHMLGALPHRTLQKLAKIHGPIMYLKLGHVPAIIVSSPQVAESFLKTHDAVCASRPKIQASDYIVYGSKGLVISPYGSYWRNARKFCTLELLSTKKIDSFAEMRKEEVGVLVQSIKESAMVKEVVDVSEKVAALVEDMMYRMILGRSKDERFDLKGTIQESVALTGAFNLADYLPFLSPFDLQGLTRGLKAIGKEIDKILEAIISDHEQENTSGKHETHNRDFVDTTLSLMKKTSNTHDELSFLMDRSNVKAILLDMIAASIDTSHTVIEWTLSELIRHPKVMKKLQEELKKVLGTDRMVEEIDLQKLQYLDAVIKESLRLHPVATLVSRESLEDIVINGYNIPKNSRIFLNNWAIGRDSNVWSENAEEFIPERFIGSNLDYRGKHFQFIPFGSGRRGCPGSYLGMINIRYVVAQLVHCFDWKLPNDMCVDELDMSEKFGMTAPRAKLLFAVPSYRLHG